MIIMKIFQLENRNLSFNDVNFFCRILGSHYSDIRGNHCDSNSAFQWKRSVAEN